jgi:hypothetical protein
LNFSKLLLCLAVSGGSLATTETPERFEKLYEALQNPLERIHDTVSDHDTLKYGDVAIVTLPEGASWFTPEADASRFLYVRRSDVDLYNILNELRNERLERNWLGGGMFLTGNPGIGKVIL